MTTPVVTGWRDADSLAEAVAARLATRMVTAQAARGEASVVLTGGTVGIATLAALAGSRARDSVDWSRVNVWWGDERFVLAQHPDRNELQARRALLDHVAVDESRVHPMPAKLGAADGSGVGDVHAAAAAYAAELAGHASLESHAAVPHIDVLLLGVGPDGHVASLFPHSPALYDMRTVVGVEGAPKPPPQRISLTLPAIQSADEVWLIAAGESKAPAVAMALGGAGPMTVPAAAATGRHETHWLLDRSAAAQLPPGLLRL